MFSQSATTGYISSRSSYKETRQVYKNGFLMSTIIFFKSTISVGMMNNQRYYFSSGWGLGVFVSVMITLILGYTMNLLVDISNDIEKKNKLVEIDTFEEISLYVSKNERIKQILYICKSNQCARYSSFYSTTSWLSLSAPISASFSAARCTIISITTCSVHLTCTSSLCSLSYYCWCSSSQNQRN